MDELVHNTHRQLDHLEMAMLGSNYPVIDLPLVHRFTPGLYIREISMPAGTLLTSKVHKTEHPFVVLSGRVSVLNVDTEEVLHLEAPYVGITKPNTRRLLYIHEDCRWLTFHPIEEREQGNVELIEERLIERRALPDGLRAFDHYAALLGISKETPQLDYGGAP